MDTDYAAAVAATEAWVALLDGDVVAFVLLAEDDDCLLLENVAVLPEHHGRGIGRALLELAESRARTLGHSRITLYTHVTMVENQALYERTGYVETARPPSAAARGCSTRGGSDPTFGGRAAVASRWSSSRVRDEPGVSRPGRPLLVEEVVQRPSRDL